MNRIQCPECKAKFKVKTQDAPKTKSCPACGFMLTVTKTTQYPQPERQTISMAEERRAEYLQSERSRRP